MLQSPFLKATIASMRPLLTILVFENGHRFFTINFRRRRRLFLIRPTSSSTSSPPNFAFILLSAPPPLSLTMSTSSSDVPVDAGALFFDELPESTPPSSESSGCIPGGFFVPTIPPRNDPIGITNDGGLRNVSSHPLSVDEPRVERLIKCRVVNGKCYSCAEKAIECQYEEAGLPCNACTLLGVLDCNYSSAFLFAEVLRHQRNERLTEERDSLVRMVHNKQLAPSRFDREYQHVQNWFYAAAQGAIIRFRLNTNATFDIARRGYFALAAAAPNPLLLLQFLSLGTHIHIHPSILQMVSERVFAMFAALAADD
ncbi:hypothetical protein K438DRAFT_1812138 [Mycena galopus ATCC 62051]|nr:hypothetical protein K438DRAFT_1860776 [Mycena galopus ATCC 62051]KAF8209284.1 hypothetical protein K438DRAFT_1812138 [Mycena galopus ATCC 62051]